MAFIDEAIADKNQRAKECKQLLAKRCKGMARHLNYIADALEGNSFYRPNSLGVCQTEAHDIDRLCYEYDFYTRELETLCLVRDTEESKG